MQLTSYKSDHQFIVSMNGRLDASWSDFFTDTIFEHIRQGEHQLLFDTEHLQFLSSAGIRSLVKIYKELKQVGGEFKVLKANDFVNQTLTTTGFGSWLSSQEVPLNGEKSGNSESKTDSQDEIFELEADAYYDLKTYDTWKPWNPVNPEDVKKMSIDYQTIALGCGAPPENEKEGHTEFGEFLAVSGHLVYQPPDQKDRPDYFIPMENYLPEVNILQGVSFSGKMSTLLRFNDEEHSKGRTISELAEKVLKVSKGSACAMVLIGEIGGLVGASLIKSPDRIEENEEIGYPAIREWLSFSGERAYARDLALIVGCVSTDKSSLVGSLKPLSEDKNLFGHFHAAVFPYQALKNGKIDLSLQVEKLLSGSPPKSLIHLINDTRALVGLGESEMVRGAVWFSRIKEEEGKS